MEVRSPRSHSLCPLVAGSLVVGELRSLSVVPSLSLRLSDKGLFQPQSQVRFKDPDVLKLPRLEIISFFLETRV